MTASTLMIQGTGSGVGKTVLTAAFCRIFRREGLRVAPFKAQNMSNNAAVCADGGEIARAQAAQAEACGIEPTTDMNPVLLKPTGNRTSQVVVHGRAAGMLNAGNQSEWKRRIEPAIRRSLQRLLETFDVVVLEGAGSPAEINLRKDDLSNMRVAEWADAPVLLVGDIDRGGVFAQLVGTIELLPPDERSRIHGFLINKFRGEPALLDPGLHMLEDRTGIPVLGVIPWMDHDVPAEDSPEPAPPAGPGPNLRVAVILLPRISNADEFEPLAREAGVELLWVRRPIEDPDLIILPGTKNTIADLDFLRKSGLEEWIRTTRAVVMGVCGGYQMLGRRIRDPGGLESSVPEARGLGLLDMETVFRRPKVTRRVRGVHRESGLPIEGYEIHMGRVEPPPRHPLLCIDGRGEGVSRNGILGTQVHGLFENTGFRSHLLNQLRARRGWPPKPCTEFRRDWDALAESVRKHVQMKKIFELLKRNRP